MWLNISYICWPYQVLCNSLRRSCQLSPLHCGFALGVIFPSFHPVSVPLSRGWQHFCCYKILKNYVGLLYNSLVLKPSFKRGLHTSFLGEHISFVLRFHRSVNQMPNLLSKCFSSQTIGSVSRAHCRQAKYFPNWFLFAWQFRYQLFFFLSCLMITRKENKAALFIRSLEMFSALYPSLSHVPPSTHRRTLLYHVIAGVPGGHGFLQSLRIETERSLQKSSGKKQRFIMLMHKGTNPEKKWFQRVLERSWGKVLKIGRQGKSYAQA